MKKIIAPVDFSRVSMNAARYAANLAVAFKAELVLMHIVPLPVLYGETPSVMIAGLDEAEKNADQELSKLAFILAEEFEGKLTISTKLQVGNPAMDLAKESRNSETGAIVMGTHGAAAVEAFFLGSTTQSLSREAACPIWVIPPDFRYETPKKIGLASDFKEVAQTTPQKTIIQLLDKFGARLEILHADPDYREFEPAAMEEGLMLETMFEVHKPAFRFLHSGYTEDSILNYAVENQLDLLVILPKEHGLMESIFRHQHAGSFIRKATIPVLVIRSKLA